MFHRFKFDTLMIMMAEGYIILPIMIFAYGWLKLPIALLCCGIMGGFFWKLHHSFTYKKMINAETKAFWIGIIFISAIWVYFSGIGSFVYQNSDYWVRNPIFGDLSNYSWPIVYDLSVESDVVKSICGDGTVAFSYYFCWWLPVAAVSKIFGLGYTARNILLYFWAVLGIIEIIYLLCRKLSKCSWIIPVIMVLFSGLDVVPYLICNNVLPVTSHIEWWANYFQYSSNTTQLFWVFNQSIPIWLIIALLLQLDEGKYVAGLLSLAFAYSPWATFGMVPIAIVGSFRNNGNKKQVFNTLNILVPLVMLLVFGSFYMNGNGSKGTVGFIFTLHPDETRRILFTYLLFLFLEFGVYFLIIHIRAKKYDFYWVTLIELILFPLFIIRDGNFIMRGGIPALFLTMYYVIRYLLEYYSNSDAKIRNWILVVVLCVGCFTPVTEFNRTILKTMSSDDLLQEQIGSFGNMMTENKSEIATVKNQFFIYDYGESFFFKYLAKDS